MDWGSDVGGLVQVVVGVDGEGGGRVGGGCRGGGHCNFWSFSGEGEGHSGEGSQWGEGGRRGYSGSRQRD